MEPPVCVPVLLAARRAATAVAEPLEDPPGLTDESWGAQAFSVVVSPSGVVARLVASGPIWVFPSRIAPPSLSRDQVVASKSGTKSAKMWEFAVVSTPAV